MRGECWQTPNAPAALLGPRGLSSNPESEVFPFLWSRRQAWPVVPVGYLVPKSFDMTATFFDGFLDGWCKVFLASFVHFLPLI